MKPERTPPHTQFKPKAGFFAAVGVLALLIGFAVASRFGSPTTSVPLSATALFSQTFADANGQPQAMGQWQGSWLVVNFWATWCAPCVEEMPDLETVQTEYANRGVTVVGLAIDNPTAVKRFRDSLNLKLPLLIAGAAGTDIARDLGNPSGALPYTVLIDRAGNIAQTKLGQIRAGELRSWLEAALSKRS